MIAPPDPNADASTAHPALERPSPSFLEEIGSRLWAQPLARAGLLVLAAFVGVAIFAPLIACSQPLFTTANGTLEFPLLRGLFNRLLFENAVDVFFNAQLVLLPVLAALLLLPRLSVTRDSDEGIRAVSRKLTTPWRGASRVNTTRRAVFTYLALCLLAFGALAPKRVGPWSNPLYFTRAVPSFNSGSKAALPLLPYSYQDTDTAHPLEAPSRVHWLGTDTEGRDVFSRLVYGTRISLTIGVVAVSLYVALGILIGACAGYFGGRTDLVISRLIEVMICIPSFFLVLTIAALVQERSIFHVMGIIGITSWPSVARLVRAEFLKHRNLDYVQAAVALGYSRFRIMFRHILPNALAPVLVSATFGVASAVLTESSLAFLGVGDTSVSSWGQLLNAGRTEGKLWLVLAPGCAIFLLVSNFNLVGEGLRDALDPKLNG